MCTGVRLAETEAEVEVEVVGGEAGVEGFEDERELSNEVGGGCISGLRSGGHPRSICICVRC